MPGNPLEMILSVLSGAGFESIAKGMKALSDSGTDPMSILGVPDLKLLLAGAGLRDVANSTNLLAPMLKSLMPQPPQQQKPEIPMAAILPAITARMGPGLKGLQAQSGMIEPPPMFGQPPPQAPMLPGM